jgi:hypothetical protein
MPYTTDVFTNWAKYDSWTALRTYLESAEGGKLRVIEPRESDYAIVRYVKGQSNFELPHVAWCRSVVVEKTRRIPVCVSPPKSNPLTDEFMESVVSAEEFVDGTMINIFRVGEGETQIATRSRLGGKARFFDGGLSFEEMFNEALKATGVETSTQILRAETISFTSTVLQHPSNRIVKKIDTPGLVVVHQGSVSEEGIVTIEEDASEFVLPEKADVEIQPYKLDVIRNFKSVDAWVSQQAQERGFGWQGVVLKNGKGVRVRVRSGVYETVRRIRGNESSAEERFARLRRTKQVEQYVAFYSEERDALYELEGRLRKNTKQLFKFYADTFRARKVEFYRLPWPYKHHVSVLHNQYKEYVKAGQKDKKIDLEAVIRYVNKLNDADLANMCKTHKLELKPVAEPATEAPVTETTVPTPSTTEETTPSATA